MASWKKKKAEEKKRPVKEKKGRCLCLLFFSTQFALLETPAAILLLAQNSLENKFHL